MQSNLFILFWLYAIIPAMGQERDAVFTLGFPYAQDKKIFQDVLYQQDSLKQLHVTISCYDVIGPKDSVKVYVINDKIAKTKNQGFYHATLTLGLQENGSMFHPVYKSILIKNGSLPAGNYRTYVTLTATDTLVTKAFFYQIDSSLSTASEARHELNALYSKEDKKKKSNALTNFSAARQLAENYNKVKNSVSKVDKAFNKKGYTVSYREQRNKTLVDLYYQGRYVGYYEIDLKGSLAENIRKQEARLKENIGTGVKNELENGKTVFSQIKELYEENKKKEVSGNITVSGNAATGQEEYSQNENNYYEVAGQVEIPVMNIPVTLEGYYTSQDNHRTVKASYLRIHYDTEQAKAELLKLISSYNNKYTETIAKGKGLQGVYQTYLNKLQSEKTTLWNEVKAETGVTDIESFQTDTSGLLKEIAANYETKIIDSLTQTGDSLKDNNKTVAKTLRAKDTVMQLYQRAMKKYEQIQELEKKARKYYALLEQYQNNTYFDSVMAYDQLKDVSNGTADEKTYKQLVKSAGNLLPEGKAKQFVTGVTSLDAGIINKEISSYTLNGQTIKGLDVGYDLGFCETGFTYGRVEYVSRDGQIDKYNGYSGRASFRPGKRQKATLIYYGYMPSRKMLNESDFFDNVDVNMPAFKNPVHILSATYTGEVSRYVHVEAEGATSFRTMEEYQKQDTRPTEKMSYKLNAEGSIPNTSIDLKGGYEHIGKQFENNSLPLNLSGIDRYTAGGKSSFFKNFLTLGVEYNYLVQQNFASKSASSKWGFDIKTTSKRYPSASLSYKPFSTFRSYSDTFNIPQRPILGEVWLGKLSYQIKKKTYVLRLTAIYNKNTSIVDTMESGSNMAQLNVLYTRGKINLMLNMGQTEVKATQLSPVHGKTRFATIGAGYVINEQWNINGGQDIGMMKTGLSRYALNLGCGYLFRNTPLAIRANFRYNTYKLTEGQTWKQIYGGMVDVSWRFRFKMNDKI